MKDVKQEFTEIYNKYIKREGADKLLEYLNKSDFFTCPASTKFHNACESGLCAHSLNVYKRLVKNLENEYGDNWEEKYSHESIAIIGLLHDICKVDTYIVEQKNVKEYCEDGLKFDSKGKYNWVIKDQYAIEDKLPYGHGEKSVYILSGFMHLTRIEAMAINWHMGGFDARVKGGSYSLTDAYYDFPLCLLTHISDLQASFLDEEKGDK
ncbi:MAG: hydrolase [Clostridiales bacterium]|nr:hydrolase [Candidatus Apopatousia equi]